MTTADLLTYYTNLLIAQYENGVKARGTIGAYVGALVADQIIAQVRDGFDLDTAIGNQLDVLGQYRGVSPSYVGLTVTRQYWQMPYYGDTAAAAADLGWPIYGQTPITWYFLSYSPALEPAYFLTDNELRRLIKLRALMQSSSNSLSSIDAALYAIFQGRVTVYDNLDMTLNYVHLKTDTDTLWPIAKISNSLAHPAGVTVTYTEANLLTGFFSVQYYGRSIDPDFIGLGRYGTPKTGALLRYN